MYAFYHSKWRRWALVLTLTIVTTAALGLRMSTPSAPGASDADLQVSLIKRTGPTTTTTAAATTATTAARSSSPTTTTTAAPRTTTTTAAPAPTTTTTVAPAASATTSSVLWSAGMENGSTSEWSADGGGGIYNSGSYEVVVSPEQAHSGGQSLRARIWTPNSPTSGVRAFRWKEARANRDLYYSAWVYIPTNVTLTADPNTGQFWNVFQFKSRTADGSRNDPIWALYAAPDGSGGYYLRAGWGWGGTTVAGPYSTSNVSGKWFQPTTRVSLPVGRWIHLEAFLHQSKDFDGTLQVWQDGTQLFNLTGIRTSYANCTYNAWCADNEWSVNLYSDGMTPNPATLYIDDAAISASYVN